MHLALLVIVMSFIEAIARDTLAESHTNLGRARNTLALSAIALAVIHLLTVTPYLRATQAIRDVETAITTNERLVAPLAPGTKTLREAADGTVAELRELLEDVTQQMVGSFATLRRQVHYSQSDKALASLTDRETDLLRPTPFAVEQLTPPSRTSFSPIRQMSPMDLGPTELSSLQAPPSLQTTGEPVVDPLLQPILASLSRGEPAWKPLIAYARQEIIEAAYARAETVWSTDIRPPFLDALTRSVDSATRIADSAPPRAAITGGVLRMAADKLTEQRRLLLAITITHDGLVDDALDTKWWSTVNGKSADAVAESVAQQMDTIMQTAEISVAAIQESLALQEALRVTLIEHQTQLEAQLADQKDQLARLSGASRVIPVDLVSFIGLFPSVIGLTFAFFMWRAGQARHQGAAASADLARVAPDDTETRLWLVGRLLGGYVPLPMFRTVLLAVAGASWVAIATWQLGHHPIATPITLLSSAGLAAGAVLSAAAWDIAAIRRISTQLHQ